MKHKRIIIFLLVIYFLPRHITASDIKDYPHLHYKIDNKQQCYASVRDYKAFFVFPKENKRQWTWYRNIIKDDHMEYSWEISLHKNNSTFNFGVYLFKFPGKTQQEGSLEELLKHAQYSVFKKPNDSNKTLGVMEDLKIHAFVKDGSIIVGVKDRNTFNILIENKPTRAFFRKIEDGKTVFSCDTKIEFLK